MNPLHRLSSRLIANPEHDLHVSTLHTNKECWMMGGLCPWEAQDASEARSIHTLFLLSDTTHELDLFSSLCFIYPGVRSREFKPFTDLQYSWFRRGEAEINKQK